MPRKPRAPKASKQDVGTFALASVDIGQTTNRYTTRSRPDTELVARCISNTVYAACNLLATVRSAQRLRLMRPKASGIAAKLWKGRTVTNRKRLDWMKGEGPFSPGRKALAAAAMAEDVEEVLEHPVLDLLYRPAPGVTFTQMSWCLDFWEEASGRAFVWLGEHYARNPYVMYGLAPQYVNVVGSKSAVISHYRYGRDTSDAQNFEPESVIYFRERIHPHNPLGAISWAHSIVMPSDMEAAALAAEIKRWENGGFPGGVIELTTPHNETQLSQYVSAFNQRHRGVGKAGGWLIIANGRVVPSAVKPHELAYEAGLRLAEERIYRAAGIPDTVWKMSESNRASAVMGDPQFMAYRILPSINSRADKLTEELLPRFEGTEDYWFVYDNPVAEDESALLAKVKDLTDRGLLTGNEGRRMLNLEPGGEELDEYRWMGTPMVARAAVESANTRAGEEEANYAATVEGKPNDKADAEVEDAAEPKDAGLAKSMPVPARSLTCSCGNHDEHKGQAEIDRAIAGLEAGVLTWYRQQIASAITPEGAIGVPNTAELERLVDAGLRNVFRAAAQDAAERLGESAFDVMNSGAAEYARQHAAELVTSVSETLRTRIRDAIVTGLDSGQSLNQIRESLSEQGIAENLTERIVRTEVADATNAANRIMYTEAGYEGKWWQTAGGPCPLCDAIGSAKGPSNPTPIDEPFYRAGDTVIGTDGRAYVIEEDLMEPTAHPNCVCAAVFVEKMPKAGEA